MNKNAGIIFSLVLCLVVGFSAKVLAYNGLGSDWRTQYPDVCQELLDSTTNQQNCIMCHLPGTKDPLNAYGQACKDADYNFALIEDLDSDGDGRTNGEEILIDCSLPGDAVSPVDQDSWGRIKVLFR